MREAFQAVLPPTEDEVSRLWQEATFIFDTNVLLDLYTHDKSTTEDLLSAIERLREQLYMPHQVLIEFARNRPARIRKANESFDKALERVDDWEDENANLDILKRQIEDLDNVRDDILPLDYAIELLGDKIEKAAFEIREQIRKSRDKHVVTASTAPDPEEDLVLARLFAVYDGRVGDAYGQKQYNKILRDAEKRHSREIPPGYEDINSDKTGDHQYGDQILWQQVIDRAHSQKADVVLVSGDTEKEDWRYQELRREFHRRVNRELVLYEPSEFLEKANIYLDLNISSESVRDIETHTSKVVDISPDNLVRALKKSLDNFRIFRNRDEKYKAIHEGWIFIKKIQRSRPPLLFGDRHPIGKLLIMLKNELSDREKVIKRGGEAEHIDLSQIEEKMKNLIKELKEELKAMGVLNHY